MHANSKGQRATGGSRFNNVLFRTAVADAIGLPRQGGYNRRSSLSAAIGLTAGPVTSAEPAATGVGGEAATSGTAGEKRKQGPVKAAQGDRGSKSSRTSEGTS